MTPIKVCFPYENEGSFPNFGKRCFWRYLSVLGWLAVGISLGISGYP